MAKRNWLKFNLEKSKFSGIFKLWEMIGIRSLLYFALLPSLSSCLTFSTDLGGDLWLK